MNQPITILSIDDDQAIRYALGAVFRYQNWNALMAADVEEGLALFEQDHPDIVLVDYHLPKINGLEGVRMLRRLSPTVPILVLTIDEDQAVADRFLKAGASDFALKPIKAPDIISRINLHIRLMQSQKSVADRRRQDTKGIDPGTLELVETELKKFSDYVTVDELAESTGLAYQTVSRYMQFLVENELAQVQVGYGKVGRPKRVYRYHSEKME